MSDKAAAIAAGRATGYANASFRCPAEHAAWDIHWAKGFLSGQEQREAEGLERQRPYNPWRVPVINPKWPGSVNAETEATALESLAKPQQNSQTC